MSQQTELAVLNDEMMVWVKMAKIYYIQPVKPIFSSFVDFNKGDL